MEESNWQDYRQMVEDFSHGQGEPAWMLELRLQALAKLPELELPLVERVKINRWPLLTATDLFQADLADIGDVPAFTDIENKPLVVQSADRTVLNQMPSELLDQGVIFTDLQTALQEHADLVKENLLQLAVQYDEDKLTAWHTAFINGGIFLYVPDNVEVTVPFEAILLDQAKSTAPFVKHLLIVAGQNSRVTYQEKIQTVGAELNKKSASIVVEIIAKAGAQVHYTAVDRLGENVTAYINRRGYVMRDANVQWALGVMNDGNILADFDTDLVETGAQSMIKVVSISSGRQIQGIDTRVTNKAPHTVGHILQHGVARDRGTLTFNGIGHIYKGAKGADAQQESRILMLSDKARGDANPILLIDENDVTAGHAASVGQVDEQDMFYLMSRGLHKEEAERLVIRGFLGTVISETHDQATRQELVDVIEGKLDA